MNALKNLIILAVLAAVGYGLYVSLTRENETGQPPEGADKWATAPTVEMPQASPSPGGPLPISGSSTAAVSTPLTPAAPPATLPSTPPLVQATSQPAASPFVQPSAPPAATPPPPVAEQPLRPNPVRNLEAPPCPPAATVAAPPPPTLPPKNPTESLLENKFAAFMNAVEKKLKEGKLAEAQLALSTLYGNPELPADQARQIVTLLDQLAGTVIYSRQNLLEPAYVTRQGDTIGQIAEQYNVPWQLLARINGLMPPDASNANQALKDTPLPAGKELKVVRGPFDAVVHLDRRELTLTIQNRYAGRFPLGIGRDQPKLEGEYTVCNKMLSPTYYGPDGTTVNPNDPRNPLGDAWIGLTERIGIHGAADPQGIGRDDNRGAICVGKRDLQDLYGILSVGSRVTILR